MPPRKAQPEQPILEARVEKLERMIAKMAHYNGNESILTEFGIEKWCPSKNDMTRFKEENK